MAASELVAVANFRTRVEAEMAAGFLKAAGISSVIQSAEGSGYGPIAGGSTVLVAPELEERALEILHRDQEA